MSKRVILSDLEIKVLLSLIDGCDPPSSWKEHTMFSEAAFATLRGKLEPPKVQEAKS